ncbi:MAG: serine hydrolase [Clostridiales bacterium]|nr:serine hydrolase [Clostridiales bacterium]
MTGASGYYIYRKTGSGSYSRIAAVSGSSTVSYTDTAVKSKNATAYTYAVRAYYGSTKGYYAAKTIVRLSTPTLTGVSNSSSAQMTVSWTKVSGVAGYQIRYSTSSSFSSYDSVTVTGASSTEKVITGLTKGKTYYVLIRTYYSASGTKYYSGWSGSKSVEIGKSLSTLLTQVKGLLPTGNGSWSFYVCNLASGEDGAVNNGSMQAASLIKLYIMGAVYENYSSLCSRYGTSAVDSYLNAMITVSDNSAANTLVSYLGSGSSSAGMSVVNAFCRNHGYTDTSMGRLLLASSANGDNYTSVRDCGNFLKEIYQINAGTAVGATLFHADKMYALLKQQTRRNKIPAQMPSGVGVANKTGELSTVENDAGIVYNTAKGVDLVIVFMSENLTAVGSAQTEIAADSRYIYAYYNE